MPLATNDDDDNLRRRTASMQAGPSTGARRSTRSGASTSGTNPPSALRAGLGLGAAASNGTGTLKRKTRSTSVGIDDGELTTSKKPALSSTFSAHVNTATLQKKLLDAQSQVTTLQNDLLSRKGDIDSLENERRMLVTQLDEQTKGREKVTAELAKLRETHSAALSKLQSRFTELDAAHEDLSEAHEVVQLQNERLQNRISSLELELSSTRRERDEFSQDNERLRGLLRSGTSTGGEIKHEDTHKGSVPPSITSWESENSTPSSEEDEDAEGEAEDELVEDGEDGTQTFREGDVFEEDAEGEIDDEEEDMSLTRPMDTIIRSSQAPSSPPQQTQDDYDISSSRPSTTSPAPTRPPESLQVTRVGPPIGVKKNQRRSNSKGSPSTLADRLSAPKSSPHRPASPSRSPSTSRRLSTPLRGSALNSKNQDDVTDHDRTVIRAELTKLMSHLRTLEASNARLTSEAARLRPRAEGAEVLREKVRDLERKTQHVDGLRSRIAELEKQLAEVTAALAQAKQSKQPTGDGMDVDINVDARPPTSSAIAPGTPVSVSTQLSSLRISYTRLLDEHGQVVATLKARDAELAELSTEIDESRLEIFKLKTECETIARQKKSLESSCASKDREIEFLKSLISSYKAEEAFDRSFAPEDVQARENEMDGRLAQMETALNEYKSTVSRLEEELETARSNNGNLTSIPATTSTQIQELISRAKEVQSRNDELEKAMRDQREENEKHAARINTLEQELFELGGEMGAGRHVPPGMRVVCLRDNPARLWADTRESVLNRLRSENEALLKRLEEIEARIGSGDVNMVPAGTHVASDNEQGAMKTVPRESWESLRQEKSDLEEALKQKEKRLLRLQQVFTAKSTEFREAIASILGLKLAFYPNGQVRVTSMYDLGASFVFQPLKAAVGSEGGETKMQLIGQGEGGPQELEQLMNYWVQQEMNIPCFLASVTLECYDKVRRAREIGAVS